MLSRDADCGEQQFWHRRKELRMRETGETLAEVTHLAATGNIGEGRRHHE
jgi:hypothetical protein